MVDVGAFYGTYGRRLRDLGYQGRILSLEPSSTNFAQLAREAAGDPSWEVRHIAAGSEPATST